MSAVSVAMVITSVEALGESAEDWTAGCFTAAELDYCRGFRDPLYPLAHPSSICGARPGGWRPSDK